MQFVRKWRNSLKFFGQLMDSYVRGIEMKLNIKQTNTLAHRLHKCWIKPALQWNSEKHRVPSLMNDWIWPYENPWGVVERSFISSLDVKMGSSSQEKKEKELEWVLTEFKNLIAQWVRGIIKRASLVAFQAITVDFQFRPREAKLKR